MFGSLNLDVTFRVPHIVEAGETLTASARAIHHGGKGLNQATALARAGVPTAMAGRIGPDGAPAWPTSTSPTSTSCSSTRGRPSAWPAGPPPPERRWRRCRRGVRARSSS
ncbi:PfkB family carbohydrate kinase [Propioniciclava coleopterorum]|uniref:PfkB family carbohydrate kinase n=1 Tax=Propioniciclava coleopterorum TaxID=2714937 RepID=UPI003D72EADC